MSSKNADHDEIVRVIQLYLDAFDGEVSKFKEAFHEDAGFFCAMPGGDLVTCRISDCFDKHWAASASKVKGRIVSVTQMGDAAGVVLLFGDEWVDFHSLVRHDGVWKITNKTATHSSRPAELEDYDEILRVVQLYLDACGDDIEKFKEAFHEDAWIFCVVEDGSLFAGSIADQIVGWSKPPSWDVKGRIVSVTQRGDAACVVLLFNIAMSPDVGWIDFHNLIRIDGVWKITNKTATHSNR